MKKTLFILSLLLIKTALFAQELPFCGTKNEKSAWLKNYQVNKKDFDARGSEMLFVPITVTFLGNDDSTGFYSYSTFIDDLCILNTDFAPSNVQFFLAQPVRYIKNTKFNNHKTYEEGQDMFDLNIPNTINCYIGVSAAGNCGYDVPGIGISLARQCMGIGAHTWAHELGHELSLPHNFSGWEGENYDFAQPTPTQVNGHDVELLDKSNCTTAGDGFCDTEPDYISKRWNCDIDKKTISEYTDPTGAKFRIRGDYFMSYANDRCMDKFSKEQSDAMRAHLLSEKLNFLATANPFKPLVGTSKPILPVDSFKTTNTKITFSWKKVTNASGYYLEVSRSSGLTSNDFIRNLKDTFVVANLAPRKYFWRVRAYNGGFACQNEAYKKQILFIQENTNTKEEIVLAGFSVFPNPNNGQQINVSFEAAFDEKAQLILTDLSGKILFRQENWIQNGENNIVLQPDYLPNGFYLLNIETKIGKKQAKIVVHD